MQNSCTTCGHEHPCYMFSNSGMGRVCLRSMYYEFLQTQPALPSSMYLKWQALPDPSTVTSVVLTQPLSKGLVWTAKTAPQSCAVNMCKLKYVYTGIISCDILFGVTYNLHFFGYMEAQRAVHGSMSCCQAILFRLAVTGVCILSHGICKCGIHELVSREWCDTSLKPLSMIPCKGRYNKGQCTYIHIFKCTA